MKTKLQINTTYKVSETKVKYKAENPCEANVLLWVVNSDGSILIKKPSSTVLSEICELTIDGKSSREVLLKLESETSILSHPDSLRKVYTHHYSDSPEKNFDVYFLVLNLDLEHKEIVEDKFKGVFIDYREVMGFLDEDSLSNNCKEALLSLISLLYEKYSYL